MGKDIEFLPDDGQYPHSTVTISLEEYRDLCELNARASILRSACITEMDSRLERHKKDAKFYDIKGSELLVSDICNIMGYIHTFRGYVELQKKIDEQEGV